MGYTHEVQSPGAMSISEQWYLNDTSGGGSGGYPKSVSAAATERFIVNVLLLVVDGLIRIVHARSQLEKVTCSIKS